MREKQNQAQSKEKYTLQEMHHYFITYKKSEGLRERTISDHTNHFRYFTSWLSENALEDVLEGNINIQCIREYVAFMQSKLKVNPITINTRLKTLRCFLKFAFDENYINEDLARKVKMVRTDKDTIKILSPEQVEALIKVIDTKSYTGFRDYVFIMLLLDCGARISEIISLNLDQIDLQSSSIYLTATTVKTRMGRQVPISLKVTKLINNLLEVNKREFYSDQVFLSVYGTPFQKLSFNKRLRTYSMKANIEGSRVSPHSFRHFFAKHYILGGGDPFTLQKILGHSDMQMLRKYINMFDKDIKIQHNFFSPVQQFKF